MTARATFRQDDVKRAVKDMKAAGEKVQRIEIDMSGKIVIYTESPAANGDAPSDWDFV
jgi:hypothetical protein